MKVEIRKNPTYIHDDGRVEIKCMIDDEDHRIFLTIPQFMEFLQDQLRALTHYIGRKV